MLQYLLDYLLIMFLVLVSEEIVKTPIRPPILNTNTPMLNELYRKNLQLRVGLKPIRHLDDNILIFYFVG